jgi:hypothetical protein
MCYSGTQKHINFILSNLKSPFFDFFQIHKAASAAPFRAFGNCQTIFFMLNEHGIFSFSISLAYILAVFVVEIGIKGIREVSCSLLSNLLPL